MSVYSGPEIVNDGLVLCLDAANPKCYPGSGNTMFDLSGFGNNAVLSGSPAIQNGIITFDGVDDAAIVTVNQTSLNFQSQQTVIIWMFHTFTSGRRNPWDQGYAGYGTWTHEQGANINYYYGSSGNNGATYTALNSGTTPTGIWQCMCVTRNTTTVSWYKNAVLTASHSNPYGVTGTTTNNITIGNGYAGRWMGNMGPVIAYNRSLSLPEIQQNFNALRGRYGI